MILEALGWLFAKSTPSARKLGLVYEAMGILARHRRHKDAWAPHLQTCRKAIWDAFEALDLPKGRRADVVILGSGPLLDVPLEALARKAGRVTLVDIVHPIGSRMAASRHANVRLVTLDLSGVLDGMVEGVKGSPLPEVPEVLPLDLSGRDLVVSLNLISQIPLVAVIQAEQRFGLSEDAASAFGRRLAEAHLAALRRAQMSSSVLMIGDLERIVSDKDGVELAHTSAVWEAELPPPQDEWLWPVAPYGEEDPHYAVTNRVGLWRAL